uniref:NADH oxidase n=1 Tax=Trepomonas sp. PC1 TaxID=1076344 RepID=A0A146KGG1_9EUKA|eukprot:JAP94725.1 NADH oxidase [Trepomonas sp. PC1]
MIEQTIKTQNIQLQPEQMKNQAQNSQKIVPEQIYPIQLKQKTVVIIGCTYAGTMLAVTLRKVEPETRIIIFDRNSYTSFLACGIHLAVNRTCIDQTRMFYNTAENLRNMGMEVYTDCYVDNVDFDRNFVNATINDQNTQFQYSKVVIATGAEPLVPPVISHINYLERVPKQIRQSFKRIHVCKNYTDSLKLADLKPCKICIVGTGLIGMEMAWAFHEVGFDITILSHSEHILHDMLQLEYIEVLEKMVKELKIEVVQKSRIVKMWENKLEVNVVVEKIVQDQEINLQFKFDHVILCAGFVPNTKNILNNKFIQQQTQIKQNRGAIITDLSRKTSHPDVYAIGDCSLTRSFLLNSDMYLPLSTNAIRSAFIVAYDINGQKLRYKGTNQTRAVQLFGYSFGTTGFDETSANKYFKHVNRTLYSDYLYHRYCNKKIEKVVQHNKLSSKFDIYGDIVRGLADQVVESFDLDVDEQDDQIVSVSICFDKQTLKILGAQCMGKQDITQQMNAVSVAICQSITLDELAQIDFGGYCGEEKPWNVLQAAASLQCMEMVDFEGQM